MYKRQAVQTDADVTLLAVEAQLLLAMHRAQRLHLLFAPRQIIGVQRSHVMLAGVSEPVMQTSTGATHPLTTFVAREGSLLNLLLSFRTHLTWRRFGTVVACVFIV